MSPGRTLARGPEAAILLGVLAGTAAAAPHFNCRPGSVAFEKVHLPDRNVVFLRQGPGCPEVAPRPRLASEGADPSGLSVLADDDSGVHHAGMAVPASDALHADSPRGRSTGLLEGPALSTGSATAVIMLLVIMMVAASRAIWDRTVRRPQLLAQKELDKELPTITLEDGVVDDDALQKAAEEEALRLAIEAAKQKAIERAEALAKERLEKEPEETTETNKNSRKKYHDDDFTRASQQAGQEEEERKSQQEQDTVLQREPKAVEGPKTQKKNGCAPFACGGCSSKLGASEPEPGRA